jgi:putative aminopeptidase FrvX
MHESMGVNDEQILYLRKLVESHGTAGYEHSVQAVFRERIAATCDDVQTDIMGSVVGVRNQSGPVRILFDGHSDEVGFLIRYIDDKGFLFVATSGAWDEEVVVGQRVLVHTEKGPILGVFGKKAIHLMDPEERRKKSELHNLWIDIGAADAAEARTMVEIGDFVTVDAGFRHLANGKAVSKAFDNRAGMFCVSEALRGLSAKLKAAVYGVSAVQEEIGLRGAGPAAYGVDPHLAIAIDVSHALDVPDSNKRKAADIRVGGGPVIVRGPNINPKVYRRLVGLAKQHEIPHQIAAAGGQTGTDTNAIQLVRSGVATGLLAIPLRYMHSPCELIALEDLDNTVRLLIAFAESVQPEDNWIPGI